MLGLASLLGLSTAGGGNSELGMGVGVDERGCGWGIGKHGVGAGIVVSCEAREGPSWSVICLSGIPTSSSGPTCTWSLRRSENDFFDLFNLPHPGKYVVRFG